MFLSDRQRLPRIPAAQARDESIAPDYAHARDSVLITGSFPETASRVKETKLMHAKLVTQTNSSTSKVCWKLHRDYAATRKAMSSAQWRSEPFRRTPGSSRHAGKCFAHQDHGLGNPFSVIFCSLSHILHPQEEVLTWVCFHGYHYRNHQQKHLQCTVLINTGH